MEFKPSKDYDLLLKQANAMHTLVNALERQVSHKDGQIKDFNTLLVQCSFEEINAERAINEQLTNENEQHQHQNRELSARVARLEKCLIDSNACLTLHNGEQARVNGSVLNESPQQSPAEIEAAAIEEMLMHFTKNGLPDVSLEKSIKQYAANLREGK